MELKHRQQNTWMIVAAENLWSRKTRRVLLFAIYTCIVFALGYFAHRSGFAFGHVYRSFKSELGRLPSLVQTSVAGPEIEHISIDIQHDDFMRLAYQREIALSRGILLADQEDLVPATIQHNGESVSVDIRLKGDSTDHLIGDKWSFRVQVDGDNTLFGMKQFSLQHPRTRNYLYEWIFHRTLDREGLVALRYDFADVTLNGKNLGVYAVEEHFEKRLIENNQSVEGPIVRFNQDLLWEEIVYKNSDSDYRIVNSFLPVDIDTYQTNKIFEDPTLSDQHLRAIYLLESFRRGDLRTSEVFDVKKLASLFAVADLVGAQHGINWGNMRFYYNPVTSRLEPIGFDGDSGRQIRAISPGLLPLVDPIYLERVFEDQVFYEEYIRTLERISEPSYLDALLAELDGELGDIKNLLAGQFTEFEFSEDRLYRNQQFIRNTINPTKALNVYYRSAGDGQVSLELGNIQSMPIEVVSAVYSDTVTFQPVEPTVVSERPVSFVEPLIDCRLRSTETVDYQIANFELPADFVWSEEMARVLKIRYRILGTSHIREDVVYPWSFLGDDFIKNDFFREEPNATSFDFLIVDDANQEVHVLPGTWQLDRNLIIPEGYVVIATGGTELNLLESAKILSYSPLQFIGEEGNPILLHSADSSGQGIVVMNAQETSVLQHVTFQNLASPSQSGWELRGAVSFYESPVAISDSQFIGSRSEDALNIVRSEFAIDNAFFGESFFDALDSDFSKGSITNSRFLNSGNDAIDTSGSVVDISGVTIEGYGDKGLSAGENSHIIASDVEMTNGWLAIASKDLSQVTVRDLTISDSEYGLTVYEKKSEFGPGSLEVSNLGMTAVMVPYMVETQSSLVVDGVEIPADQENVFQQIYGTE